LTVILRKNGLAIAKDFDRTSSAVDLYSKDLVSYSNIMGLK